MGLVTSSYLIKQFKYAVLLMFSISAILTPPDVVTQVMMAGPLLCLYGISIIVAKVSEKKKAEKEAEEQETHSDG
jgi:sec-independent protein translocase protein TatC